MFGLGKNNISVADALAKKDSAIFLDVRTRQEYETGHITESRNIDFYDSAFTEHIDQLDKEKEYIVYCSHGGRGSKAARLMDGEGFGNVRNLEGGLTAWEKAGNYVEH